MRKRAFSSKTWVSRPSMRCTSMLPTWSAQAIWMDCATDSAVSVIVPTRILSFMAISGAGWIASAQKNRACRQICRPYFMNDGRGERIRTFDPLVPNQMRYQAALRPDSQYSNPIFGAFLGTGHAKFQMAGGFCAEPGPSGCPNWRLSVRGHACGRGHPIAMRWGRWWMGWQQGLCTSW